MTHPPATPTRHQQQGAVAVLVAILLVVLLGIGALAIDGGNAFLSRAQMQNAADAAAHAGAVALVSGGDATAATNAAIAYAASNGYTISASDICFPQTPGSCTPAAASGSETLVRVEFNKPVGLFLGKIIGAQDWNIGVAATAGNISTPSPACLTTVNGLIINGNDLISMANCSAAIGNASGGRGITNPSGNNPPNPGAGISITGSGSTKVYNHPTSVECDACSPVAQNSTQTMPALPAPLAIPTALSAGTCTTSGNTSTCTSGSYTKSGGKYPFSNSSNVIFNPGPYVFNDGLDFAGTVTGTGGVTLFIPAGEELSLGGAVELTAPACGQPNEGVVISSASTKTLTWAGNNVVTLKGIIDVRLATLEIKGSSKFNMEGSLLAGSMDLRGNINPQMSGNSCFNVYTGTSKVALVE